jgi:hypothetical protein
MSTSARLLVFRRHSSLGLLSPRDLSRAKGRHVAAYAAW